MIPNNYQLMAQRLPVYGHKAEFMRLLDQHNCVIMIGETGSGKTTQVPQWCVEYVKKKKISSGGQLLKVVCTQPRRIATVSVARRVADEMGVTLGTKVGYSIRFENCTGPRTRLKFLTDGSLMRELCSFSDFNPYGVVILDEAHERSLSTDILLGFLKDAMRKRPQLKVIVMSATVNEDIFCEYFTGCAVLRIPGRLFPVDIRYTAIQSNQYQSEIVTLVVNLHITQKPGDILVFLTGEQEIEEVCAQIRRRLASMQSIFGQLFVLPLYSVLSLEEQQRIFDPVPCDFFGRQLGRKCIVSTNIAETSLTIDGIYFVIDSGRFKQKRFLPQTRVEQFTVEHISKASAKQRAGRAGRTAGGKCIRMYTEEFHNQMDDYTAPEILKCNFANVALLLKRLGVNDLAQFNYMVPPTIDSILYASDLLRDLGALDQNYNLTSLGVVMSEFPVDPPLSKMLVMASQKYNCSEEMLTIVSMLSAPPVFARPRGRVNEADRMHSAFVHPDGDHLTLINVYKAYIENNGDIEWCRQNFLRYQSFEQAVKIRNQLEIVMRKMQLGRSSLDPQQHNYSINIRKCILEGFFSQIAYAIDRGVYSNLKDPTSLIKIHLTSKMRNTPPEWLIYNELNQMERSNVLRTVSAIDPCWLFEVAPHYFADLNAWPAGLVQQRLRNAKTTYELEHFNQILKL